MSWDWLWTWGRDEAFTILVVLGALWPVLVMVGTLVGWQPRDPGRDPDSRA